MIEKIMGIDNLPEFVKPQFTPSELMNLPINELKNMLKSEDYSAVTKLVIINILNHKVRMSLGIEESIDLEP